MEGNKKRPAAAYSNSRQVTVANRRVVPKKQATIPEGNLYYVIKSFILVLYCLRATTFFTASTMSGVSR